MLMIGDLQADIKADMEGDIMGDTGGLADRGEGTGLMEPLLIREAAPQRGQLLDLVRGPGAGP